MNPVFIFLVILGAVLLWFLLSFAFFPLGNLFSKVWKDTIDRMNKEENLNNEEETEK
jgi:hypothetical protein